MNDLEDIAVRFQVYLEGLKTGEYREFNKVLRLLEAELARALAVGEISSLSRSKLEKIIREVARNQTASIKNSMDALIVAMKEFSLYSYEFEAEALALGSTAPKIVEKSNMEALWKAAVQRPLSTDGGLLEPWIDKLTSTQVNAVSSLLRRAHAESWTNSQVMQVMRGTRANRFTDGLTSKLGRSNSTVIRTALQHINSTSRMRVWEENKDIVKQYQWVSTLDSRTSRECRGLDGQRFDIGEGPIPPIHPNCRSTTVAVLSEKYDVFDRGATRSSATGRVPQEWTYYDWLKTQSPEFQDSVIGPTRGALLRDGGLSSAKFARLQLSRTFEPLTLDEMRRLNPLAFKRAGI